ncbi:MAG TPA: CDP-alcohol phosphatidyltransferase family protein [Anaerolineales bacterium]|nr:CDP-alcohol phosphatidyltransferase family protein [Anaerolineales bacterium]
MRKTFTDFLRVTFKFVLDPIARLLNRLGLTPITVTLIGVFGSVLAAVFVARGQITIGGIIMLIAWPIDALDGTMARLRGEASDWGAFVDSVSDRYSELIILGALLYYFAAHDQHITEVVTYAAAAGSVLVSYVKARAEAQSFSAREGLLTRAERYLILGPSLLFNIPAIGVWIIAILANITALQRIWFVRAQAHANARTKSMLAKETHA